MSALAPEERLALLVARLPSAETRGAVERLVGLGLDWGAAVALLSGHRLRPLAYLRLRDVPGVPDAAQRALRVAYRRSLVRNTILLRELAGVGRALADAGVGAVALKGPVLSERLYGDVAARETEDLDVLIPRRDLDAAHAALAGAGYAAEPHSLEYRLAHHYHRAYTRAAGGAAYTVEVHWHLLPPWRPFRLRVDEFWARAGPLSLDGARLRVLSPEDEFLVVMFQLLHHHFGLSLWADLGALVERWGGDLDWPSLHAAAHRAGASALLAAVAGAAGPILGLDVPGGPAPSHAPVLAGLLDPVTVSRLAPGPARLRRTLAMWLSADSLDGAALHAIRWWIRPVEWVAKSRRVQHRSPRVYWSYLQRLAAMPIKAGRLLLPRTRSR